MDVRQRERGVKPSRSRPEHRRHRAAPPPPRAFFRFRIFIATLCPVSTCSATFTCRAVAQKGRGGLQGTARRLTQRTTLKLRRRRLRRVGRASAAQ